MLFFLYLSAIALTVFFLTRNVSWFWGDFIRFSESEIKMPTYNLFAWIFLVSGTCFLAALLTQATEEIYNKRNMKKAVRD
jgi:hypothetical protein